MALMESPHDMKSVQDMGNSGSDNKDINSLFEDILMTEDPSGQNLADSVGNPRGL